MKEQKFESYFGRRIAIDAGMSIYQFLIVVGRSGTEMLTNEAGEVTRTLKDQDANLNSLIGWLTSLEPSGTPQRKTTVNRIVIMLFTEIINYINLPHCFFIFFLSD
ncbi:flap endonuclease 1 isoform X1 [Helianthus annuus]|uniref:flap endonuclease 1 isoform X1 n=1 Tax=Helianthus annuus TaxID=4232 RepID=UPI000B8EF39A|nr:flap endonuclease 1 isoform X1 [Helianthus annuus]XP_035838704.1 flap endonuclease 1 isoform X1 [Helianthus annuus]